MFLLKESLRQTEAASLAEEALDATGRKLLVGYTILQLACWLIAGLPNLYLPSIAYFLLGIFLVIIARIADGLMGRNLLLAVIFWLAAHLVWTTIATYFYPLSFLRYFFLPIPMLAVYLIGWPAGVLAEVFMILCVALVNILGANLPLLSGPNVDILIMSGFLGLVGWLTSDPFITVTYWASYYSREAHRALEDARSRQVHLSELRDDLITSNEELARVNRRLKTLEHVASEARQTKVDFVARVSHELRAPLNMIIGFSEILARTLDTRGKRQTARIQADLDTILRNARHLSRLVDDVLDLSQIESGQMALVRSICNVADIVQSAVMVVLPLFQSKGLSLETELPPNLPEVFWDEIRIRQILINLLANSGRFTQTGGAVVRASIEANDILFIVQDSGPGIPYEQQARLFEPFQQADFGLRREHGGSGLGLSISKHFVELHGGKIGLQSSPGTGTTITFRLPVHYDLEPVGQPADRASRWFNPYSSNQVRTRPFTAFLPSNLAHYIVVDQDTVLSYFLKRYMQDVRVTVVPTIDQALKEVARAPAYAMLINDPGILSPEQYHQILAKLEALPYQTPAIVFWQPGKLDIVRQLGVLDYIIKPVNAAALLTAVQKSGENIETVLLVDDEEDSLQLLMRILLSSDRKYRILRSYTGEDALYVMRTQKPDLVLLDMSIPDKDGLRILQEKTADEDIRHIPVLVVSATDPVQETFTANTLLVKRASSLSMVELIQFIQSVSQVFLPEELSGEPVSKGNPVD